MTTEVRKLAQINVELSNGLYMQIEEKKIIDWAADELSIYRKFQQDNAPANYSTVAKNSFMTSEIT